MPIGEIDDEDKSAEYWCERCLIGHPVASPECPQTAYAYAVGEQVLVRRRVPQETHNQNVPQVREELVKVSQRLPPYNDIPIYWVMLHTVREGERHQLTLIQVTETQLHPLRPAAAPDVH